MTGADRSSVALESVELWRVRMPLRRAHRAAHGTEADRDLILVAVRFDDGVVGWGECSTLWPGPPTPASTPPAPGRCCATSWRLRSSPAGRRTSSATRWPSPGS